MLRKLLNFASDAAVAVLSAAPPAGETSMQEAFRRAAEPAATGGASGAEEYAERSTVWKSFTGQDAGLLEKEWIDLTGSRAGVERKQRDTCVGLLPLPCSLSLSLMLQPPDLMTPPPLSLSFPSSFHISLVDVQRMGMCIVRMESVGESFTMQMYLDRDMTELTTAASADGASASATRVRYWEVRRCVQARSDSVYLEGSKWKCAHCAAMVSNKSSTCHSCGVVKGH